MANKFSTLAAVAAGAALGALALAADAAQAATFGFSFTLPSGFVNAPAGSPGAGVFTFDDALVNPNAAFQQLPVTGFQFDLLGRTFTASDAAGGPDAVAVNFFSGRLAGLNFDANSIPEPYPLFAVTINESDSAFFDQQFNTGNAVVSYSEIQTPNPIPTPALLPGLVGLGAAALRQRKDEKAA
jgi:hypothetical protein